MDANVHKNNLHPIVCKFLIFHTYCDDKHVILQLFVFVDK